jgi:sigma-B regulation protein RsbU (phosphoserine phosphatase)
METAKQLREAEQKIRILHEITRFVSSLLTVQHVLDAIVGLLVEEFKLDACSVRLLDKDGNLRIRSHRGLSRAFIEQATRKPTPDCYSGETFLTGKIVIINDSDEIDKPISTARTVGEDIRSFALTPIIVEGEPIGVLVTASKQKGYFHERFNDIITIIASQIGIAIRISQLYEEINELNRNLERKVKERTEDLERKAKKLIEAERLAAMGKMSQRIAHECRNSLAVVGGLARRLDQKTPEGEPEKEYTRIIVDEVKNLENKVSAIISFDKSDL